MSKLNNRLLGHAAESDGIEEFDNPLPDWWLGMFWFTIVFAFVYTVHYHFVAHRSQPKALAAEIAEARARWPESSNVVRLSTAPAVIAQGRAVFMANCIGCHGANLQGGIGPNLTDAVWIHGNRPRDVVQTITNGVAAKGMPTWGPILGAEKVKEVASFIASQNPSVKD